MARDFTFSQVGAISDASASTITAFSLVGWFRWDGNQHSTTLITGTDAAGPTVTWSHALRMTGADLFQAYAFDGSVRSISGTTTAAAGTWYHVAMTAANGGAMKLYVNGALEATSGFTLGTLTTVLDRWRLGNSTSGTLFWSGDMAEVALFYGVLSSGDIAALAAGTASPLDVGAPRWYFPLCGTGTEVDLSANVLTLTWPAGTPTGSAHPVGIANGCGFALPKVGSFAFGADMDVKASRAISFNVGTGSYVDSDPNTFAVHSDVNPIILDGDVQITGALTGGGSGAPAGASYLTLGTDAGLTSERVLTAGAGITLTDGGAGSTLTIAASGSGGTVGATSLATHSTTQNATTGVTLVCAFDSEQYDTNTMHSTVTNTSRLTFTTAGRYLICAYVQFASNGTGYRYIDVRLNGSTVLATDTRPAVSVDVGGGTLVFPYTFSAADYIEVRAFQNSGSTLAVTARLGANGF